MSSEKNKSTLTPETRKVVFAKHSLGKTIIIWANMLKDNYALAPTTPISTTVLHVSEVKQEDNNLEWLEINTTSGKLHPILKNTFFILEDEEEKDNKSPRHGQHSNRKVFNNKGIE